MRVYAMKRNPKGVQEKECEYVEMKREPQNIPLHCGIKINIVLVYKKMCSIPN